MTAGVWTARAKLASVHVLHSRWTKTALARRATTSRDRRNRHSLVRIRGETSAGKLLTMMRLFVGVIALCAQRVEGEAIGLAQCARARCLPECRIHCRHCA